MNNDIIQESETKEATIQQGEDENEERTLGFSIKGWKPKTFFNRKKYSPLTEEEKFTIDKLHQMGWSTTKIQKEIGIPHATVSIFLRILHSKTQEPKPTLKNYGAKTGKRTPKIKFNRHQRGEIRRLAKKGYTRIQIAKELGVPLSVITYYVYRYRIHVKHSKRGQGGWNNKLNMPTKKESAEKKAKALELYKDGYSWSQISNKLHIGHKTISKLIKMHNIWRGKGRRPNGTIPESPERSSLKRKIDEQEVNHQDKEDRLTELVRLFNKRLITEEEFKKLTDYLG